MNRAALGWISALTFVLIALLAFATAAVDRKLEDRVAALEEHHQLNEMGYRMTLDGFRLGEAAGSALNLDVNSDLTWGVYDPTADVILTIPDECSGVGIPGGPVPCVVIPLAEYEELTRR